MSNEIADVLKSATELVVIVIQSGEEIKKIELNMKTIMRNGSCLPKGAEYILNLYTYEMLDTCKKFSFYPMG
uniref:Uncharacterized protein n=1 Tax=Glossina palpalis gambiensis TaxID=67801 RepID=A0A1B0BTQ2_9MUSC